jgi:broad specificity phosphatase PhoE
VNALILARHAHSVSNAADVVNALPPGHGLSETGTEEARALGRALASEPIEIGVSSRLQRARDTLALALAGRGTPCVVEPLFDEIDFGSFEGRALADYRAWAWAHGAAADCPGGGESRADAAVRVSEALGSLLHRPEGVVLTVSHALPVRYVLDAAQGRPPSRRVEPVPHATAFRLERAAVERAAATLVAWAASPAFADAPFGG